MRTIFVIDDDQHTCNLLADVLQDKGYQVLCTTESTVAWQQLQAGVVQPDLIVLDLAVLHLGGWTFRAQQRATPALAAISVIVLTARSVQETDTTALDTVVMARPFGLDLLIAMVQR